MKRMQSRRMRPWRELPLIESVFVAAFLCLLAIALLSAMSLARRAAIGSRLVAVQMNR